MSAIDAQTLIWIGAPAAAVLLFAVLLLLRRQQVQAPGVEAYLEDISRATGHEKYELSTVQATMLGRIQGKARNLDYVIVPKTTVGRRHAMIVYKDHFFWIIDEGSTNGTFVNGKRVEKKLQLKDNDVIKLHDVPFRFCMPSMAAYEQTVIAGADEATQLAATTAGSEEFLQGVVEEQTVMLVDDGAGQQPAPVAGMETGPTTINPLEGVDETLADADQTLSLEDFIDDQTLAYNVPRDDRDDD